MSLIPVTVTVGHENANVRHPASLVPGVVAEVALAGEAGPVAHAGVGRTPGTVDETARAAGQDAPGPTPVLVGTAPVAAVVVLPLLRVVVRKAMASALPLRLVPGVRQRSTPLPQDTGATHAPPMGPTVGGRVPLGATAPRTVPGVGALLLLHCRQRARWRRPRALYAGDVRRRYTPATLLRAHPKASDWPRPPAGSDSGY